VNATQERKPVVTRFAPSPTGYLHIGGARTALFNWLFARHHGGTYLLRIEDTDRARSTDAAIDAILDGLDWLGLGSDQPPVYQFSRAARHAEVAHQMLAGGHAYKCFATPEELAELREQQRAAKQPMRYDGRWRDRDPAEGGDRPFVIRLKAPREGETVIEDAVQGRVVVKNAELDDMILLRSDGTPTYMLAVVVDDHDMGVTHVIRGDDHLNNAFRQLGIIKAMGWDEPVYAHIPLIHGADGAKLSKRHGAMGVDAYRDELGMLPEAVCNYLLRLGWGHGDEEIVSRERAIELFDLAGVGRHPQALCQTGMFTYDPGFTSTAAAKAKITYIDGDEGVLLHRGYPIEQLAEKSTSSKSATCCCTANCRQGAAGQFRSARVTRHTMVHEQMHRFFRGFRRDAHPMAIMCGVVGALSAFYHDSTDINDPLAARGRRASA
jgi:glutamyl/glutaminyl-tRNA synthetase